MSRDHQWIDVGHRRWCITCDAYQMKTNPSGSWKGWAGTYCPRTTLYAKSVDAGEFDPPPSDQKSSA
jgi:hypothetical protein